MTEVETTCCTECSTELEAGQTGLCEECESARPRPFDELSEKAKEKAREDYTSSDYPHDEWWDAVYEDAVRMGKMLGITIEYKTNTTSKGRTYETTCIWFSGFCSQGDGACFDADYTFAPDAIDKITEETDDKVLLRIAQKLTMMQLTQRLKGVEYFTASISSGDNNWLRTEIRDWGVDEVGEPDENEFQDAMQDFADWIYRQLDDENDHFHSDEYVDEQLSESDCMFDESGAII